MRGEQVVVGLRAPPQLHRATRGGRLAELQEAAVPQRLLAEIGPAPRPPAPRPPVGVRAPAAAPARAAGPGAHGGYVSRAPRRPRGGRSRGTRRTRAAAARRSTSPRRRR